MSRKNQNLNLAQQLRQLGEVDGNATGLATRD